MEQKYPGLSEGIILKNSGIKNTLEEEYRTADILSEIIKEVMEEK